MPKVKTVTTVEDFELFKESCEKYADLLGLKNWNIVFKHGDLKDEDCYAFCALQTEPRMATIVLNKNWNNEVTDEEITKIAIHEVMHVLLGSYSGSATNRFTTQEELEEKEHGIVQTLTNVFYDLY